MFRRSAALLTAVAALGLSACGAESVTSGDAPAESEAQYLDLAGLKYQVQLTRQLNPMESEDRDYFKNIAPADAVLPKGSIWFGVFLRVENEYDEAKFAAREFEIEDTRGNKFAPVVSDGVYAYKGGPSRRRRTSPTARTSSPTPAPRARCCSSRSRSRHWTTGRSSSRSRTRATRARPYASTSTCRPELKNPGRAASRA